MGPKDSYRALYWLETLIAFVFNKEKKLSMYSVVADKKTAANAKVIVFTF